MKKGFWNKRIPTILGLLLITIGIGVTSYFVNQGVFYIIKATPTDNPQEVRITNITDSTATVSFSTNGEAIGSINLGENKEALQKILDDKDQASGEINPKKIHSITARNLKPQTKYYFSITSGEETYLNEESFYELTTGAEIISEPPKQEPITGKILLPDGEKPNEAIIYATINDAQIISTVVKEDGTYILPLNSLRNKDLSSYFEFKENTNIKMTITGDGYSSNVLLSIGQINPVPPITLSKDYDFTTSLEPEASSSAKLEKLPSFPASSTGKSVTSSLSITSPEDDQTFSDLKPEFKGKALPDEKVKIIINSENQIETEVTTDKYGNWSYRPDIELSPGEHTITIISTDTQGILRTITKSFTVYASGSLFSDTLSPTPTITSSITPTITQSPTITPTPTTEPETTISPTITITPTIALSPTITPAPTQIVIQTPTPTVINATPSAIPAPPDVGSSSLLNLLIIGITTTILGVILLLLSRGSMSFL